MYEALLRPHEVSQVPAPISIESVVAKSREAELEREARRQRQIAASKALKRKRAAADGNTDRDDEHAGKRAKAEQIADEELELYEKTDVEPAPVVTRPSKAPTPNPPVSSDTLETTRVIVSRPFPEVRGHTSYLTFACHPISRTSPPAIPSAPADPAES